MTENNGKGRWLQLYVVGMGDVYAWSDAPLDAEPLVVSRLTLARTLPTPDGLIFALGRHPGYDRGLRHALTIELARHVLRHVAEAPAELAPTLERAWSRVAIPGATMKVSDGG